MKIVICEKNIAARRIAQILSYGKVDTKRIENIPIYEFIKDNEKWKIIGLRGHVLNLDFPAEFNYWRKISPRKLIDVEPYKKIIEKRIVTALNTLVENSPFLIIATDYDREGELIGVEIINLLKKQHEHISQIKRAKFSAITPGEITTAFQELGEVDYNLSNAGEARQQIDLFWGAVLTRFISLTSNRLGKDFLSIGRVQSPTLAILVEREKEITNFQPQLYWRIIARLQKDKMFDAIYHEEQIWDEQHARRIYEKVKDCPKALVQDVQKERTNELPPPPFNTTTFLQAASSLGFSAEKAMNIAEGLYMAGLISYPRTDNTVYPQTLNLKRILEKLTTSEYAELVNEVLSNRRKYPTRGKKQTTDHPPIHPVGIPTTKLLGDQHTVYELICRRFLATLANDALSETTKITFNICNETYIATGYRLIEANWKKIYTYFKENRKTLPEMVKGEAIKIIKIILKKESTKPPKRYTQGALIAKMEQLSLGTKSTRHEIIHKLYTRKYIYGSSIKPTSTAIAVIDAVEDCDVTKPKMTATLEEDMNLIAEGKKTLQETVQESRQMLITVVETLEKQKEKIKTNITNAQKEQNTVGICPKCRNTLIIRTSKKGKRFVGCMGYPSCKNTYSLPQTGILEKTEKICSCGAPIIKVKSKGKRPWMLCLDQDCTKGKGKQKS